MKNKKRLGSWVAVLLFVLTPVSARTSVERPPALSADQREILRLEDVIVKAWSKRDTATIGALTVDDFQYWSFKGARRGKADLLRTVASSEDGETQVEDRVVRVYGDAAIFTARIIDRGKHENGAAFTATTCVTTIFVRRNGKWQMAGDHETLVQP